MSKRNDNLEKSVSCPRILLNLIKDVHGAVRIGNENYAERWSPKIPNHGIGRKMRQKATEELLSYSENNEGRYPTRVTAEYFSKSVDIRLEMF